MRVALLLLVLLGVESCSDDMVEQPSYQPQEAPRRHSPDGSVPRASRVMPSPGSAAAPDGATLFAINCAQCHGGGGAGDGPVAGYLKALPRNLRAEEVQGQQPDALYEIITNGHEAMPSFRGVLSTDERWALARFVKSLPAEPVGTR